MLKRSNLHEKAVRVGGTNVAVRVGDEHMLGNVERNKAVVDFLIITPIWSKTTGSDL
jgi:hypothetical protein